MIELKQLEGKRQGYRGSTETIKQPVDEVLRDGKSVALCSRFSGAPVCFVLPLSKPERNDIRKEVARLRDEGGEFGPPSEKTQAPPAEIPAEEDEDDEESEIWTPDEFEE